MPKRPPQTVLEVAVAVGGYRKGFRVATYIAQWTIAQRALGHEPTVEEAAAWWKESRRTWFKYQSEFREIFDRLDTPGYFAERIIADSDAETAPAAVAYLGRLSVAAV